MNVMIDNPWITVALILYMLVIYVSLTCFDNSESKKNKKLKKK